MPAALFVFALAAGCAGPASQESLKPAAVSDGLQPAYATGPAPSVLRAAVQAPQPERARPAASFLKTLGVATHFSYDGSGYATQFMKAAHLLTDAGLFHIRDEMHEPYEISDYIPRLQVLGRFGVHGTFIVAEDIARDGNLAYTPAEVQGYPAEVGPVFARYEAPNEQDLTGGPNWVANARALQAQLWNDVQGSPASKGYPVLGPSLTRAANYALVGNLSQYLTEGNIHDYLYGYNPETTGSFDGHTIGGFGIWWNNVAGSIAATGKVSGSAPVQATETGYCTNESQKTFNNVDYHAQEAYALRLYFTQFLEGIVETDFFQFIDVPNFDGPDYGYCGLLDENLNPKPAYHAIKNLSKLLHDGGFTSPGTLSFAIVPGQLSLKHVLLEKRDGTFYLALWRTARDWDALQNQPGHRRNVPVQNAAVQFGQSVGTVTAYQFDDAGALNATPLTGNDGTYTVGLNDFVTILSVAP